jgi:hypothetical protein
LQLAKNYEKAFTGEFDLILSDGLWMKIGIFGNFANVCKARLWKMKQISIKF